MHSYPYASAVVSLYSAHDVVLCYAAEAGRANLELQLMGSLRNQPIEQRPMGRKR